ncbi:MAG: hypothetical protein PHX80_03460 [Candidatus Nanoarchaeia archaeon]|nr:hypothetical protein [Candidatus Nanoarchaeia archaeon]MDD5589441.1 hypothetical protein [Candidatus Nanoarchaeia archaeon]
MNVDLHNHFGRNGKNPGFDKTIDLVSKKLGKDSVIGFTNCSSEDYRFENFVRQSGKYERVWVGDKNRILFVPEKQVYVIGTEEVITKQGHLLVAGTLAYNKIQKNDKSLSLEDALKSAEDFNGIKIAVHPFGWSGTGNYISEHPHLLYSFDGWEVYNASSELAIPGFLPSEANQDSSFFYNSIIKENFPIGACAFTDGHSAEVIGRSYTKLDIKKLSIDSLRKGIKENTNFENLYTQSAKFDAFKHAVKMVAHKYLHTGD